MFYCDLTFFFRLVQEDLYEDIGQFQQETPPAIPSSMIPPPLPGTPPPLNPAPPLPTRVPSVPDRRPVGQGNQTSYLFLRDSKTHQRSCIGKIHS